MTHFKPTHFENFHLRFWKVKIFFLQIFIIPECLETCKEFVSGNGLTSMCLKQVLQSATRNLKKSARAKFFFSKVKNRSPSFISIHHRNFNVSCSPEKKAPCDASFWSAYYQVLKKQYQITFFMVNGHVSCYLA